MFIIVLKVRDEINVALEIQSKPELLGVSPKVSITITFKLVRTSILFFIYFTPQIVINTEKGGRLGLEFLIQVRMIITLENREAPNMS